jgi:methionyl-tRNA formyltransferase
MNNQSMRIVYAGTPDFATPALRALVNAGYEVVAVYTQPDRRAGRGRKLVHGPVKTTALELELPVLQPDSFKTDDALTELAALQPDLMVVAAYGLILPQSVLDVPTHGCINIHASLLPRWRGAAPIHRAIEAGDAKTGVTIMQMQAGLDTGDMLLKKSVPIESDTRTAELHDALALLGADALLEVLDQLQANALTPEVQNEALVTYAHKLEKSEALLDWTLPAQQLHRKICAFNPWPVAQTSFDGDVLRVWQSELLQQAAAAAAGTVVSVEHGIDVSTGDGTLRLLQVQAPGKKAVAAHEFVNSSGISPGQRFGE